MTKLPESRACNKCQKTYPITKDFWQAIPNSTDGFRKTCLNCKTRSDRQRYLAKREQMIATARFHYWKNPAKKSLYDQKLRQNKKAQLDESKNAWAIKHRKPHPIHAIVNRLNNHSKLANTKKVRIKDFTRMLERNSWQCFYCKASLRDLRVMEIDHVIPRSRGGGHSIGNYMTICVRCNREKAHRLVIEYKLNKIVFRPSVVKKEKT